MMNKIRLSTLLCGGALALSLAVPLPAARAQMLPAPTNQIMMAPDALDSTQWKLISPSYAGLTQQPTIQFDNARLNASVGLNQINGSYKINGEKLSVTRLASTKMAGPAALMNAESQYSKALQNLRSFEISRDGNTLSLRGPQVLTFERVGKTINDPLASTQWQLVSPGYAGLDKKPTLQFSENRLNASVGLNQISGEYSVSDLKLKVSPLASTRMAGPPALMTAETQYSQALQSARSFELTDNGQTLTLHGDTNLKFERVNQNQIGNDPLAQTRWNLSSPGYVGLQDVPTLRFEKGRLSASVGLNRIGGAYAATGKSIRVSNLLSTKMAGSPAQMAAENQYAQALAKVSTFEISRDGNTLSLRGPQVLTFTREGQTMINPLASTKWELMTPKYAGAEKTPTLTFDKDSLGASVGLNVMGAGYQINGDTIALEQFISTMMAGPPALMEAEDAYKKALAGARTYEVSADGQTLTLRGDTTLLFASAGRVAPGFVPTETKIINVEPQLGPEFDGDAAPKYLQLEDLSQGVSWGRFTEPKILGFDYQPGNRYQLRVQVERDAQSGEKQLRLLEVFSQHYVAASPLGEGEKILEVAPTKVDCVGVAPMKCLQVREVGGEWRNFYAPIEGFDFVEGSRYRLQVKVSVIANPPADGSSLRYQLVRVLDKMPVTY